jgi:hypothetical protein
MPVFFNMKWLLDMFIPNFTITKKIIHNKNTTIYEYVYGSRRYLTDTWPPNIRHNGFPIKSVKRDDGIDVTQNVLKFSGPMRNYVHPLGVCVMKKKVSIKCHQLGGLRFELKDCFEKYKGTVIVEDIFNGLKIIHVE